MSEKKIEHIQLIIPIYNEEECLPELFRRLDDLCGKSKYSFSFILINDGSVDMSYKFLKEKTFNDKKYKVINLSRNWGHQIAVTAGLDNADADYIAIIDGDLQDPPELVPNMVDLLKESNSDLVFGRREKRAGESLFKKATAKVFYRFLKLMCDIELPVDTGDFRVFNRKVLDAVKKLPEKNRYLRGLFPWIGYKHIEYKYEREKRVAGITKYPLRKMIKFASDAIMSFSSFPLKIARKIGSSLIIFGLIFSLYLIYKKIFTNDVIGGMTSIVVLITIIGGGQIYLLGIVGEYIGRIFDETKKRPLYFIDEKINL